MMQEETAVESDNDSLEDLRESIDSGAPVLLRSGSVSSNRNRNPGQRPMPAPNDPDNKEEKDKCIDAQAPGKPTKNDGFVPPKNWDGKKVKNPNGSGYGWPDSKGRVWVPTGPKGHGGAHWDVQIPGGDYRNILPGGKVRGEK